ncbi:SURF1 family protein [Hyphobacterium sp. CCMP332]|uniref:SURF1 family protein n=1 Tax=Hyphobacterium sp. CCMP332 TaxID=2749086 RepID=UPI00164EE03B|nr:SURF1 family protein [Hyphobacterium sp. CCMP332]QNL19271.1 SURF1 family protein [Hyphobacterium sp. CCMP332]
MFRPLPLLTLLSIPALALLIWLGAWQFGRMAEKADAISGWESREVGDPADWQAALCDIRSSFTGRAVFPPDGVEGGEVRFHGRSTSGELGWRLMSPVPVPACFDPAAGQYFLVQTGFETFTGNVLPAPDVLMFARPPEPGAFDAANNVETGEFFRYEAEALSSALGGRPVATDFWMIAAGDEMPPQLANVPPGQHLGYALTWWGLAIGLIAVYLLMHVQAGRLRFTRR